ncbi:putative MORF4 family-associated protein 1-like protein UPP [Lutra lutra]|uniref:putative MORF4 family-associated protein 1-like protein UPP n=1 Tax=Lutra lutra TaxID=9657 RepID=UPI001FD1324B|nr:putative MORF4 family-associated protein 1-like protein UPP [Lutra lutra]XP_047574772.1 putative MORF4 family-associated protein 1-like protein UPP [Lutra lutra]
MRTAEVDERREPERPRGRTPSPARPDVAALERERVRAHLRARRTLLEVANLLDELQSAVDTSAEGVRGPGRYVAGEAEERVLQLCEKAERKAAEAALVGRRIVELHRQIDRCGCS